MGGVETQGTEHRREFLGEIPVQPAPLALGPLLRVQEPDALAGQRRQQFFAVNPELFPDDFLRRFANDQLRVAWRDAIRTRPRRAVFDTLPERRDPDFEELVEQIARDANEPQALQQLELGVARHGQHPPMELEQAELTVHVKARVTEIFRRVHFDVPQKVGAYRQLDYTRFHDHPV